MALNHSHNVDDEVETEEVHLMEVHLVMGDLMLMMNKRMMTELMI